MDKALSGVRIIDMTHNQAGPACAQILGFLGADVIKLEEPKGGDIARRNMRDREDSDSLFFLLFNANKRSLTLNLKTARGKELFKELIAKSDVLVENFSPGALDRLGLGAVELGDLRLRLRVPGLGVELVVVGQEGDARLGAVELADLGLGVLGLLV